MARLSLFVLLWTGMTSAGGAERVVVPEGDEAVLNCSLSTKEDLTRQYFLWRKDGQKEVFLYEEGRNSTGGWGSQDGQFKGRVSYSDGKLKNGDASINIINSEVADSGNYTCVFPRHEGQTFLIELVVGAAKPYVTNLNQTETWALLQCEVLNAHPEPTVKWQDSTGNKLPDEEPKVSKSGDRFSVILRTRVTKTDNYHCVVTQEEISHQAASKIYVRLSEESHNKLIIGLVGFVVGGVVVGLGFVFWRKARGSGSAANQTY